jgi:serine/threonine protein kinase
MDAPFTLPGFTDLEPLGQGGTSTVWKARQARLQRTVAIKILRGSLAANADELQRFLREARAAAAIMHPNLVQVIDAGEHEGLVYTVMEFVPGSSVADLLSVRNRYDDRDALHIATDLARALDYCWRNHRMVHGDIKPGNIMIHSNGTVKLADMGLASLGSMPDAPVEEGMTVGTPNFMSPEQATTGRAPDARSDIYSLGATLYQMCTGVVPFGAETPEKAMHGQVYAQIDDPWVLNPGMSPNLAMLIEKWMSKRPEHRPADWTVALHDLEQVARGLPPVSIRGPAGASTVQRARTRPVPEGVNRAAAAPVAPPPAEVVNMAQAAAPLAPEADAPVAVRRREELHSALLQLAGVALLVVLLYGFTAVITHARALNTVNLPPPSEIIDFSTLLPPLQPIASAIPLAPLPGADQAPGQPPPARPDPPVVSTTDPVAPPPAAPPPRVASFRPRAERPQQAWLDPEFVRALKEIRAVQDAYQGHIRKQARADLPELQDRLTASVRVMESLKARAPASTRIGEIIRGANQLRFNIVQARKSSL